VAAWQSDGHPHASGQQHQSNVVQRGVAQDGARTGTHLRMIRTGSTCVAQVVGRNSIQFNPPLPQRLSRHDCNGTHIEVPEWF
jgi:hypothetical protein